MASSSRPSRSRPARARAAAGVGRTEFAAALGQAVADDPGLAAVGAVVLYETLGPTLSEGMAGAAPLWFSAQQAMMNHGAALRAAGFESADELFDAMIERRNGVVFTRHTYDQSWSMLNTDDGLINLDIPELVADLVELAQAPVGRVRVTTPGGSAVAVAEVTDTMLDGHVSLPNGLGLDYAPAGGEPEAVGVAPNELTTTDWRDPYAGTPWHKHVPARLEPMT